jgi:hypothetical protein
MASNYRDDLAATEERLARLEAARLERELHRLRDQRAATTLQTPPTSKMSRLHALALICGLLVTTLSYFDRGRHGDFFWAMLVMTAFNAMTSALGNRRYVAWQHRRIQAKAMAKLDAEIASLESLPVRLEVPTLEAARIRIAELEAEEAAAEADTAQARFQERG